MRGKLMIGLVIMLFLEGLSSPVSIFAETTILRSEETGERIYYDFKLGSHKIGENSIEFRFPGNMDTLYLFNLKEWKRHEDKKTKLVVSLYDKNYKLIDFAKSVCTTEKFFGSLAFSKINKSNVGDVAYFLISLQDCIDESQKQLVDYLAPEVKFAKQIEAAVMVGKEVYFALFSEIPSAKEIDIAEKEFEVLKSLLERGGELISVLPMDELEANEFKHRCKRPFYATFAGGLEGGTFYIRFPIGEVNGEWKILYFN